MIKEFQSNSTTFDELVASIVDIHSKGVDRSWLTKRAAAGVFSDLDIKPEKDHSYIHIIAMGDSDVYGMNSNGDIFYKQGKLLKSIEDPSKTFQIECGNLDRHHTFVKHAKVYRDHKNKPDSPHFGTVKHSAHNDNMHRVELILRLPNDQWESDLQKMAKHEDTTWSMACNVPYDICVYCLNKAAHRDNYCDHAKNHMTEMTKEGHKIGVANDHMLYFDISRVRIPADQIAMTLMKAASVPVIDQVFHVPDIDPITLEPIPINKMAILHKLSDIEKEILGSGSMVSDGLEVPELPDSMVNKCQSMPKDNIENVINMLSDAKVCLSLKDLFKLIMGRNFSSVEPECDNAKKMLPGVFTNLMDDGILPSGLSDVSFSPGMVPGGMFDDIQSIIPDMSLDEGPVNKRVIVKVIRGGKPKEKQIEKSSAAASVVAKKMAEIYGLYKVSMAEKFKDNKNILRNIVLHNFV